MCDPPTLTARPSASGMRYRSISRSLPKKPGSRAVRILKHPIPDIETFDSIVRALVRSNPLGCTPYFSLRKNYPPVQIVREMYTAKFAYTTLEGKRIWDKLGGLRLCRRLRHRDRRHDLEHGKHRSPPGKDTAPEGSGLFKAILKCNDQDDGIYFVSLTAPHYRILVYE